MSSEPVEHCSEISTLWSFKETFLLWFWLNPWNYLYTHSYIMRSTIYIVYSFRYQILQFNNLFMFSHLLLEYFKTPPTPFYKCIWRVSPTFLHLYLKDHSFFRGILGASHPFFVDNWRVPFSLSGGIWRVTKEIFEGCSTFPCVDTEYLLTPPFWED